ncbi:hypothetical protein AN1V17_27580 [Vallitalea sediminicola]
MSILLNNIHLILTFVISSIGLGKILLIPETERKIGPYYLRILHKGIFEITIMLLIFFYVSIIKYSHLCILNSSAFAIIIIIILLMITLFLTVYRVSNELHNKQYKFFNTIKNISKRYIILISILFLVLTIFSVVILDNMLLRFILEYRQYGLDICTIIELFIRNIQIDESIVGSLNSVRLIVIIYYFTFYIFYRILILSTLIKTFQVLYPYKECVCVKMKNGIIYEDAKFITRNNNIIIIKPEKSISTVILFTNDILAIEFKVVKCTKV